METKYLQPTSPAAHEYFQAKREVWKRVEALDRMVEFYNEFKDSYTSNDGFAESQSKLMESHLGREEYQRVIRSSIEPFFVYQKGMEYAQLKKFAGDGTKAYFEAHGGYQNAHKAKFTVWNPYHHY